MALFYTVAKINRDIGRLYLTNGASYTHIENEYEIVCDVSNGAIFNDLERP